MCLFVKNYVPVCCHLLSASCQDVPSFGSGGLCLFVNNYVSISLFAVKMSHLSAVGGCNVSISLFAVKMSHLLSASCQDVPSFGSGGL